MKQVIAALLLFFAVSTHAAVGIGFDASLMLNTESDRYDVVNSSDYTIRSTHFGLSLSPTLRLSLSPRFELDPYLIFTSEAWGSKRIDENGDVSNRGDGSSVTFGGGAGIYFDLLDKTHVRMSIGPRAGMLFDPQGDRIWITGGGVFNLDVFVSASTFFRMGPRFLLLSLGIDTNDNPVDHTILRADWIAAELRFAFFKMF
jgi:hypothetical protein